jgi:ubiquitin-protein ligase
LPKGSLYEGQRHILSIRFPQKYPFSSPILKFETKIWHPNIFSEGKYADYIPAHLMFGNEWVPSHTVQKSIENIIKILQTPDEDVKANEEAF